MKKHTPAPPPPLPAQEQVLFDLGDQPARKKLPPPAALLAADAMIARVQLEGSAALELDYAIPESLAGKIGIGSRVVVPLQNQRVEAVVIGLPENSPHRGKLKEILSTITSRPMFTPALLKLADWIAAYYLVSVHQVLRTMLPQAVRSKPESFITDSHLSLAREWNAEAFEKLRRKAPMQARVLEILKDLGGEGALSRLRCELPRATTLIKPLLKDGWLIRSAVRVERDPFQEEEFLPTSPLKLTDEQITCLDAVIKAESDPANARPILLHGVTGSGKTEVYLQAIAGVLERGRTALVLVPEISLTPQTIERFKARFSDSKERVAVLHSMLSEGERHDEWFKIHEGRADIVIGARSAIFAPLERLGLIIVDEEHEPSYKQEENPRYHARDLAVVRAKLETCAVVLGSATPSLESFENARAGKYELVRMTRRTDNKKMPLVRVVDLRLEKRKGGNAVANSGILSERLRIAINWRLERREQTILFLNRRGFNTSLSCMSCGEAVQCHDCSIAMKLHKKANRLVCHVCGSQRVPPSKCPACSDPGIKFAGFGTERVETVVRETFPKARIARVDTDTMQRKHQLRDVLRDFRAQKLDILIGTQMIAKGLDFPNVTLVGVLNADLGLHMPDFRAAERTFQLLVQVAGRAGRGEVTGEVLVQTFTPHSPAIQHSRHCDFEGFSQQELDQRRQFNYPPYSHVILITSRGKHQARAEFALNTLHKRLQQNMPEEVVMGDPAPAPLEKSHGQFRFQLLMRTTRIRHLVQHLRQTLTQITFPTDVAVVWDVDPVGLL
jgi:primosomal protein N' (replication factor Y)